MTITLDTKFIWCSIPRSDAIETYLTLSLELIKSGFGRSRCVNSRQSFLISKMITNIEMPTIEFYSTYASPWTLVFSFCVIGFLYMLRRRPALPFPPGPKGLPIIGNALDMPSRNPWLTYWQWGITCSKYFLCAFESGLHLGQ
jgi:hypothetical protein